MYQIPSVASTADFDSYEIGRAHVSNGVYASDLGVLHWSNLVETRKAKRAETPNPQRKVCTSLADSHGSLKHHEIEVRSLRGV